jgi:hypothetical protein
LIFKAANSSKPKPLYHINHNPLVSLLSALPAGLKSLVVKNSLDKG